MTPCIKEIPDNDDFLCFELFLPALGAYHVRHSRSRDGIILGAYVEDRIIGVAVLDIIPEPRLTYVFVEETFRNQGIGVQLVRAALTAVRAKKAVAVEACVILQNEYGEVAARILERAGFEVTDTATILRFARGEHCRRKWSEFKNERGARICSIMERRGFKTLTFSEASSEILDRLKASIGSEFDSELDPFRYMSNQNDRFVPEYSFITVRNDEPAAFVKVVTTDGKSLVFQHLSVAMKYQGSGVFLLPYAAFMEKFLTGDTYNKVAALVYKGNEKMQKLVDSFIGSLTDSMKTQNIYQCNLEV